MSNEYTCRVCGNIEDPDQYNTKDGLGRLMVREGYCFTCAFWAEHYEADKSRDNAVIVDGTHYLIGKDDPNLIFRGFGGVRFEIEFHDGRRVATSNLWCQGSISPEWRKLFPDNARFIRDGYRQFNQQRYGQ